MEEGGREGRREWRVGQRGVKEREGRDGGRGGKEREQGKRKG